MKTKKSDCPSGIRPVNKLLAIISMVLVLVFPHHTMAQIHYFDVNPDTTIVMGGLFNLDINHDGLIDFQISVSKDSMFQSDEIRCLHDSCFVAHYILEGCYLAAALEWNDSIANETFHYQFKPDFYTLCIFQLKSIPAFQLTKHAT